ncbi:MarR family transcriptional regulator [Pseudooceanicola sp. CBS1P-1]|uniref:MarR family transcriptional regulator n=1 Tax=Pseudooceanicola albus TaxID=2692189 RepID=A0A6L7G3A2_9RHOB|nr:MULTISPECIES: MarR family transcriptional regulator [Pseudooceanicola]MBT9384780.1 MarR family transcriptional regulator [Pseudooceanicola endophyticus]MXN18481.1 MarR family transcriptional regulator [Pseudooceanicola albus]
MDRTDDSLIALRRILRATELFGKELAHAAGLSPVQFRVLQLVAEQGMSTPKAISVQMGVTQATITALLDRLEKQGMITRARSQVDRRQMNIAVTEKGRATVAEAPDPLQQRYVRQFESLKDWEQAQIIAALERVASMLDAEDMDASPVLHSGEIKPS